MHLGDRRILWNRQGAMLTGAGGMTRSTASTGCGIFDRDLGRDFFLQQQGEALNTRIGMKALDHDILLAE